MVFLGSVLGYLAYNVSTVSEADYGGTYVEGVAGQPNIVNPLYSQFNAVDRDLAALVFNGLTYVDETGRIQPDLARAWEISPSGLVYTFTLRSDAQWSDGAPVTSDDVLYTLRTLQSPDYSGPASLSTLWRTVAITALNESSIRFQLSEPFAPFLEATTIGLLPSHILQDVPPGELARADFNRKPVGTGPFTLDELNSEHALLRVNPRFFGVRPYLDTIVFRFYPDQESVMTGYQREQIEGMAQIDLPYLARVRQNKNLVTYSARISGLNLVFLNLSRPPFQAREVRQALLYGANRATLVDELLQGQGIVANSPISPYSWAYDGTTRPYAFEPAQASALLTAAGWITDAGGIRIKNGAPLSFTLTTNDDPLRVSLANELADQWRALGARVNVRTVPAATLVQDVLRPRQFDAVLFGFAQLPADPDPYALWDSSQTPDRTGAGQNYGGWENDEVDDLLQTARRATDQAQRVQLYQRFQQIFADDVPALLLYYPVYTYVVDARVRGIQIGPMLTPSDRFRHVDQWFIKTRRVILSEAQRTVVP